MEILQSETTSPALLFSDSGFWQERGGFPREV